MSAALELVVLVAALAVDRRFGEPPNRLHPVAWIGGLAGWMVRFAPADAMAKLVYGGILALAIPSIFALASSLAMSFAPTPWLEVPLAALLLKTTFSVRGLGDAAHAVRDALTRGDIAAARQGLGSLCSRDASTLGETELVAATVESVAENASDSIVAPLLYYALLGLPAAVFYRAVNTLDAMIGYHGTFEHLGKAAAWLDDLLNFMPARLTAGLLLLAGFFSGAPAAQGWRILRRDGWKTESPNAGRPMAAMAGLLSVELEKPAHYCLGEPLEPLAISKIDDAWRLVGRVAAMAAIGCAALIVLLHG